MYFSEQKKFPIYIFRKLENKKKQFKNNCFLLLSEYKNKQAEKNDFRIKQILISNRILCKKKIKKLFHISY